MNDTPLELKIEILTKKLTERTNQIKDLQTKIKENDNSHNLQIEALGNQLLLLKSDKEKLLKDREKILQRVNILEKSSKAQPNTKIQGVITGIKSMSITYYHIITLKGAGCGYCTAAVKEGEFNRLRDFGETYKVPNFTFIEIRCDWNDFENNTPPYSNKISAWGENFLVAKGNDVDWFPSFDVTVILKNGTIKKNRFEGVGKWNSAGEIEINMVFRLISYLANLNLTFDDVNETTRSQYSANAPKLTKRHSR